MTEFYCRTHHTNNCLECAIENQTKQLIKANLDHSKSIIAAIAKLGAIEEINKKVSCNKKFYACLIVIYISVISYIAWPLFS